MENSRYQADLDQEWYFIHLSALKFYSYTCTILYMTKKDIVWLISCITEGACITVKDVEQVPR